MCRGVVDKNRYSLALISLTDHPQHQVGDHEVPVFLRDPEVLKALDWDLALRRVIPHIDGVKYAKRIAMDAEVSCACVAGLSDGRRGATSKSDSNAAAHL